jgi:hypothetical protein
MDQTKIPPIFTPDNEPYIGRQSVFHFDQVILTCLEANAQVASYTHNHELTPLQQAACQIIPQGINLALSIRELVRQGYLFGAVVLMRPLIERTAIISYLCDKPEDVKIWQSGWKYKERPSLALMLSTMQAKADSNQTQQICEIFNHIVHGDPIGSTFDLVDLGSGGLGYSVGKILNETELCDSICFQSYCYLIVLMSRMVACFPETKQANEKK